MNGRGLQETKRAHTNPTESALPELRRSVCLELFAVAFCRHWRVLVSIASPCRGGPQRRQWSVALRV